MSNTNGPKVDERLLRKFRLAWITFGVVALCIVVAAGFAVERYGRASALTRLEAQARTDADLKVALLQAVLERPRALPLLLAGDREVRDALVNLSADAAIAKREALDAKLEDLVVKTNASVIYVVGPDGIAISSSNWREPTSFVGNDYTFRAYFTRAMQKGAAEHFALGSVSKRPGLYISQRVGPAEAPLGVVVAKMEFDQLEADWRNSQRPSFVVDSSNVVLITSLPSWRFMTTQPLDPDDLGAIRQSLQFGDAPLLPLPFIRQQPVGDNARTLQAILPGGAGAEDFLEITTPIPSTPWRFEYLLPISKAMSDALRETRLMAILVVTTLLALAAFLLRRRQVTEMAIAQQRLAREDLENRVAARTIDLSLARDRLEAEIMDHKQTESRLQSVQQDLVHANRLAILGQVAAGVAHEINQPVATIRAYADNSKVLLERGRAETAVENLDHIASLTERIGAITDDLKALARKGRPAPEPVLLQEVFDGATMLVRSRFTGRMDTLKITPPPSGLVVMGSRLRLEQVFINLFQNALEAVEGRPDALIQVTTDVSADRVLVHVCDNGPGIAPQILKALFEPFNSSKEKGLGLGLVISKDIVTDYGGRIEVESRDGRTCFTISLVRADEENDHDRA
ncbi:ATP-binding protein [Rhizobium sp. NFR12]|uniref:sensor histidine kinase n=1 Tax=Rhizobium sp. NFR12 TaxID=1566261 RepID=UPI0008A77954|nr:ATP-binding protein [Rhizobium sp. NFR12]SEH30011.1 two-component system, NtrC family, C4-dicarboxylate transport sensor histidine kinase DctB [Rhizobium sp. NFR12]